MAQSPSQVPTPNTITLGVRFQHMNFEEQKHQSIPRWESTLKDKVYLNKKE